MFSIHFLLTVLASVMMIMSSFNSSRKLAHLYVPQAVRTNPVSKAMEITKLINQLAANHEAASQAKLDKCLTAMSITNDIETARTKAMLFDSEIAMNQSVVQIHGCLDEIQADCVVQQSKNSAEMDAQDKRVERNRQERLARFQFHQLLFEDFTMAKDMIIKCFNGPCATGDLFTLMETERTVIRAWNDAMIPRISVYNKNVAKVLQNARTWVGFADGAADFYGIHKPSLETKVPNLTFADPLADVSNLSNDIRNTFDPAVTGLTKAQQNTEQGFAMVLQAAKLPLIAFQKSPKRATEVVAEAAEDVILAAKRAMDLPAIQVDIQPEELAPAFEILNSMQVLFGAMTVVGSTFLLSGDFGLRVVRVIAICWTHWNYTAMDPRPVDARSVIKKRYAWHFADNVFKFLFVSTTYAMILAVICLVGLKMYSPFYHDYRENCVETRMGTAQARNSISIALRMANAKVPLVAVSHAFQAEHQASKYCSHGILETNSKIKSLEQDFAEERSILASTGRCNDDTTAIPMCDNKAAMEWEAPVAQASYSCDELLLQCDLQVSAPTYEDLAQPIIDAFCDVEKDYHFDVKMVFFSVLMYSVVNVLRISLNYAFYLLTLQSRRTEYTDILWEVNTRTGWPGKYNPRIWRFYMIWLNSRNLVFGLGMIAIPVVSVSIILVLGSNFDDIMDWAVSYVDSLGMVVEI